MTSTSNPTFDAFVQSAIDAGEEKKASRRRSNGGSTRTTLAGLIRTDVQANPDDEWHECCARVIRQLPFAEENDAVEALLQDEAFADFAAACWQHKQTWFRVRREVTNGSNKDNQ